MLLGYIRISKFDGSQSLDLQRDVLLTTGVAPDRIYEDLASGRHDTRPGLEACLKALRPEDTLVVWKLDRLGRNLRHLVTLVKELRQRAVGFKVLTGQGAQSATTTANGRLGSIAVSVPLFTRPRVHKKNTCEQTASYSCRLASRMMLWTSW